MSGCSCYYNKWLFFSFQTMYVVLPGLLDCNPFGTESASEQCRRAVGVCVCAVCVMPEAVRRVVSVFQTTSDLLQQYQVHSEIQSQMFAYLFFFTNVSLFNQLIDKGLFKLSDLLCFCVAHTRSQETLKYYCHIFSINMLLWQQQAIVIMCQQLQAEEKGVKGLQIKKYDIRIGTKYLFCPLVLKIPVSQWTFSISS